MGIKIRDIDLGDFPLLLAPMEDVSDPPFRALCKRHGADLMFTEFISSEGLIRDAAKSVQKLDIYEYERPVGIQIFGHDIDSMIRTTEIVEKTNPDINLTGGDENYLELNGYKVAYGRNFTVTDVESGRNVCIIGSGVAEKLYPDNPAKAVDKVIKVDHIPYRVLAVLEDKGSSAFFNTGKVVITSYNNIRRLYASQNSSFVIAVMVNDMKMLFY